MHELSLSRRPYYMNGVQMDFLLLLQESARIHGHLCPGQVLGVRMSLLGLGEIGISDPIGKDKRNIMVFVEIDRCATDAVRTVTGCSLGHRTMKFMDYGKMAVSFLNLSTGYSVRIVAREEPRRTARDYFPEIEDKFAAQREAYKIMPDEELFDVREVTINVKPEDMPGRPLSRVQCEACGEHVQDARQVYRQGKTLCKSCADTGYYEPARRPYFSPALMRFPRHDLGHGHQVDLTAP